MAIADQFEQEIAGEAIDLDSIHFPYDLDPNIMIAQVKTDSAGLLVEDNITATEDSVGGAVELTQENVYKNLDPTYLYNLGDNGVLTTYLADALSLKPLVNSTYALVSKLDNQVLISGITDDIGL